LTEAAHGIRVPLFDITLWQPEFQATVVVFLHRRRDIKLSGINPARPLARQVEQGVALDGVIRDFEAVTILED
jgi:hypothetical protein